MVVEGMRTAFLVNEIARREHIDMPITEEVCRLLEGEHTAQEALENLMTRAKKAVRRIWSPDKNRAGSHSINI